MSSNLSVTQRALRMRLVYFLHPKKEEDVPLHRSLSNIKQNSSFNINS